MDQKSKMKFFQDKISEDQSNVGKPSLALSSLNDISEPCTTPVLDALNDYN